MRHLIAAAVLAPAVLLGCPAPPSSSAAPTPCAGLGGTLEAGQMCRVQANGEESGAAEPSWAERLRAALADAECEVSAELGSNLMSLRDVLALKTGELIPLRTGREGPIVVRVAGRARFLGAPGVAGGSNAVRVTGRI